MGAGGDHGAKVSAKGADWEDGGEEMKRVSRRGEGRTLQGREGRGGWCDIWVRRFSGEEEERDMYKTSGHGRAFLARAWCFLGGRRRDIRQDTIECVFDGRSGESRVPSLRRTENTEVGDYGIGDEGESGQEPLTGRDGLGQVGQDSGDQGEASPLLKRRRAGKTQRKGIYRAQRGARRRRPERDQVRIGWWRNKFKSCF